jgi:hypothetical protein
MCSCSKDITNDSSVDDDKVEICFKANTSARGIDTYSDNLTAICVTCYASIYDTENLESIDDLYRSIFFKNVIFRNLAGIFYSDPAYYWPKDKRHLTFTAYAPLEDELGTKIEWFVKDENHESAGLEMKDFRPKKNISEQVDFVYGASFRLDNMTNDNPCIAIPLDHMLSRIRLTTSESNTDYNFKIKGLRIAEVGGKADFITGLDWANISEPTTYEYEFNSPFEVGEYETGIMSHRCGYAFLIPQRLTPWDPVNDPTNENKGSYLALKIQITDTNGNQIYPEAEGEFDWAAMPLGGEWKEKNDYVYHLDFTSGAGYTAPGTAKPGKWILNNEVNLTQTKSIWGADNINM